MCKLSEINNSLAVFCMATYGEGDPTDNAQAFNEWLQSGEADLSGVNFAVSNRVDQLVFVTFMFSIESNGLFSGVWSWKQNL